MALAGAATWRSSLILPPPTLVVEDAHGRWLGEVGGGDDAARGFWPLDPVPPRLAACVLAAEDRRFAHHPGVDPVAVVRALMGNWRSGRRVSGASTLAMQVARMQNPGSRTWPRKVLEAVTAVALTVRHGRRAVLAQYLALAPFGGSIRGAGLAARRYFDATPWDLGWAEAALLAALPQAPGRMDPTTRKGLAAARARAERILAVLLADGSLGAQDHELALRHLARLAPLAPPTTPPCALHHLLALRRELGTDEMRRALARRPLVRSSLDLEVQLAAEGRLRSTVRRLAVRGVGNGALVVVDLASAAVVADVGSTDFFDADHAGAIDYASTARSPGSVLKPFIYALALDRGLLTPATVLDDLRRTAGGIGNADDRFLGPLLPRQALATSRNVPAADLLTRLGVGEGYAFLATLGLHDGWGDAPFYGAGIVTGTLPVTVRSLAEAYTALACDGWRRSLRRHDAGAPEAPCRVVSTVAARQVQGFLADPLARLPVFPRLGPLDPSYPLAAKTGTSSGFRDSWTVAWTSRHLVAVWLGHPDARPMTSVTGHGGAARAARAVLDFLERGSSGPPASFPPPEGCASVPLCSRSGGLATEACPVAFLEWLPADGPVPAPCSMHRRAPGGPSLAVVDGARAAWGLDQARTCLAAGGARSLRLVAPVDGARIMRCPETPAAFATLGLEAVVEGGPSEVLWLVDGSPWRVSSPPHKVRWPLTPGTHVFQASLAGSELASSRVSITVD